MGGLAVKEDMIPVHILDHIDKRVNDSHDRIIQRIDQREEEDFARYATLQQQITEGQESSQKRHEALLQSIQGYMSRINTDMHEAPCPHLKNSIPEEDWAGHKGWHVNEMDWNKRMRALKWFIVYAVAATAATAFFGWMAVLMWMGFLKGPVENHLPEVKIEAPIGKH